MAALGMVEDVGLENRPVASEFSEIGVLAEMTFLWLYTHSYARHVCIIVHIRTRAITQLLN